jgi:hypothetical protein
MMNEHPKPCAFELEPASVEAGASAAFHCTPSSWHLFVNRIAGTLRHKIEPSDGLLLTYIMVFVRQYLWFVDEQGLVWVLTPLVSAAILLLFAHSREERGSGQTRSFYLVVALPLFLIFALRLPFPDFSFDVTNYHLVHAERALRGWPFMKGDFFPTIIQLNPAPDMVSGIFRYLLGYRLGTIVNYFALLWAASIIERLLRPYIKNQWTRCACVLLVVSTELILYLLNLYLIDLLALPLLLEATRLSLRFAEARRKDRTLVHIALFLGISTAFKVTNLAFAAPLVLLCAYHVFTYRAEISMRWMALAIAAFIAPLVPFSLYMYWQTGNPAFPFYNRIFKSPYMEASNYEDAGRGPKKFWEYLIWPVLVVFYPERLSEMTGLGAAYTGRLSIGYIIFALCLCSKLVGRELKVLCLVSLAGSLLWSLTTGNGRYGIYLEATGTIAAVAMLSSLYRSRHELTKERPWQMAVLVVLFGGLLAFQSAVAYHHVFKNDQALYSKAVQQSVLAQLDIYLLESRNILHDYSAEDYLSESERETLDQVGVWINSYSTTSGVEVVLKRDAPMLSVSDYLGIFDFLKTEESRKRFDETLAYSRGKRMFSICPGEELRASVEYITRTGLTIGEITPLRVPFYSQRTPLRMVLIEVLPPGEGMKRDDRRISQLATAFARDIEREREAEKNN